MARKMISLEEFKRRGKEKFGDKFDYSLVDYTSMTQNVVIKCPIHGFTFQSANNHLNSKHGCYGCYLDNRFKKANDNQKWDNSAHIEDLIDSMIEKGIVVTPYNAYKFKGYSNDAIVIDLHEKGLLRLYNNKISERKKHRPKPKNAYRSELFRKKYLDPFKMRYEVDEGPIKHLKYIPFRLKLKATCKKHGDFFISIHSIARVGECYRCKHERLRLERQEREFLKTANKLYGTFYDYSHIYYKGYDKPIYVNCPIHGVFETTPKKHVEEKDECKDCVALMRNKRA